MSIIKTFLYPALPADCPAHRIAWPCDTL